MHARAQNPAPWVPWLVTAGLVSVGVGGILLARRASASPGATDGNGNGDKPLVMIAAIPAGGASGSTAIDDQHMRGGVVGVFTSWFTQEVQQEIIGRMISYRNQNGIKNCRVESEAIADPFGGGFLDVTKWRTEAEAATRQVLQSLYPNGAPWDPAQFYKIENWQEAEETTALWRWWLWKRVMQLADVHVCQYIPIN